MRACRVVLVVSIGQQSLPEQPKEPETVTPHVHTGICEGGTIVCFWQGELSRPPKALCISMAMPYTAVATKLSMQPLCITA